VLAAVAAENFGECTQCGACYDLTSGTCSMDGGGLAVIPFPRMLGGRYRLERRRGRGGMGTVYAATDNALGRHVAIKVIRDDLSTRAGIAQRFHRESRTAAAFSHPNVVTVHDYGIEAGTCAFLVMELLEGGSLRDELNRCRRLSPARTVSILRGVCAAVDAAHRRQIIHRDLKPENIFLARGKDEPEEIVKILDFGVAKSLPAWDTDSPTRTFEETDAGVLVGTLAYMSPEQLLGGDPAVSWDLWALTVIVYEMLTGSKPFPMQPAQIWRDAVLAGRFIPPGKDPADSPPQWGQFFARSFAREQSKRPQSASEFLSQLEQALA
jgi:serine/threonine-protein kinase